jgi:salicylate hydroxylase
MMVQRRWEDGRTLMKSVMNPRVEDVYGDPIYTLHRADLQGMLASALPPDRVHLGKRFAQLTDKGDCVEAQFDTGERITVDVLVGADGIHSAVRGALFGDAGPGSGRLVAYRGQVPIERIPDPEMATISSVWVGAGAHFVHYAVSRGRILNFVGCTEHDSWNREDWTDRTTVSRALNAYIDWHPHVRQIISAAHTCFTTALFDREPLPRWSVNRTTLLGDACHAMYPFMGQGAAQAIEDGAVLAEYLAAASAHETCEALGRYEALRLPRVSLLQEMSRANEPLLHAADGPAQVARDAAWAAADDRLSEVMHWLYGFDAQKLELMDPAAVQALLPRPQ